MNFPPKRCLGRSAMFCCSPTASAARLTSCSSSTYVKLPKNVIIRFGIPNIDLGASPELLGLPDLSSDFAYVNGFIFPFFDLPLFCSNSH